MPSAASGACTRRDRSTVIRLAIAGFTLGSASTVAHMRMKFTSMLVTRMSTPKKKSEAK